MRTRLLFPLSRICPNRTPLLVPTQGWICSSCRAKPPRQTRRSYASDAPTPAATAPIPADKPYYITTPIFYVNAGLYCLTWLSRTDFILTSFAAPHVGHLYTMVLTDILKRYQVLKGRRAIMVTGTDEHGMKIQQAAARAGSEPKPFCDKGAQIFKVCRSFLARHSA